MTRIQGKQNIMGDNVDEDADTTEVPMAMEMEESLITGMIIKIEEPVTAKDNGIFNTIEGEGKIIHLEGAEDNGMEMTLITMIETTGTEILINQSVIPGYQQQTQFSNPNHYRPPPMGHQYRYPIPYEQYSYPQPQQYQSQMLPAPSQQAVNICQLCHSQGHYNYQCQFAGDFMARTQKAFNQGRSYSHQDPNHGEWSHGNNDDNDPNGQPFQ